MKKTVIIFIMLVAIVSTNAQIKLKAPGVKWETNYSFDKCNSFKMEFYAKNNEVAIQIFGSGGGAKPYYNAGGFKYPAETDLKKLEIVPTTETKQINYFTF